MYYIASGHIFIIDEYMKLLGFNLVKTIDKKSSKENQCVENIIPFDEFFRNK